MSIFGKSKLSPRDMSPLESRGHVVRFCAIKLSQEKRPTSLKFCARRPSLFGRGHRTVTVAIPAGHTPGA